VSIEEIRRIAELPPRDQLLAQVAGTMRAPIAGLVYTLGGLLSKFVRTVDALREEKQGRGEKAEPPETAVGDETQPADGPAEEPAASAGEDSVTE
jgi:hypothetical protein